VPALHLTTWHDGTPIETIRFFDYLQQQGAPHQHLIIGAGPHCTFWSEEQHGDFTVGDLHLGDVRYGGRDHGYRQLFGDWFDHWLNGAENAIAELPPVQLYVMRHGWVTSDRWPLPGVRPTRWYLGRGVGRIGALTTGAPEQPCRDTYVYDPDAPLLALGGTYDEGGPARDQSSSEGRGDVLLYETAPLERPLTLCGPIEVVLHVSSSARDTDFIVKLIDVHPDGKAINLDEDAFRVRYRDGFDRKALMEPGEVYALALANMVTGIVIPPGHRIRLQIASSEFPAYERNLNTGGDNFDETAWVVAENTVHHGPPHPSHVVLPLLD
jgi:putative CocE/NonD family hydrolase